MIRVFSSMEKPGQVPGFFPCGTHKTLLTHLAEAMT